MVINIVCRCSLFILLFSYSGFAQDMVVERYPSGNKKIEGAYSKGKMEGIWKMYFDDSGRVGAIKSFSKDKLNGTTQFFDSATGTLTGSGEYNNGRKEGIWIFRFAGDTSRIEAVIPYINGRRHGEYKEFYYSGLPVSLGYYKDGRKTGDWVFYYDREGLIRSHRKFFNGLADGYSTYYDSATQQLYAEGKHVNGYRQGTWLLHYPENGKIMATENYMNDRPHGKVVYYYPSGVKWIEGECKFGARMGNHTTYYENKAVQCVEKFSGSEGYSVFYVYDSITHKVIVKGERQYGRRVGNWYRYYPGTDSLMAKEKYKDGELDGKYTFYYKNGKESIIGQYNNGNPVGKWELFHENGQLWVKEYFKNGKFNGELVSYYTNGNIKRKENYNEGRILSSTCYSELGDEIEYTPLIENAKFDGDIMDYIGRELKYPELSKASGVEGKVVVSFSIDEDGNTTDIAIEQSLNNECDNEAMRLVGRMPKWAPGKIDGQKLRTEHSIPVVFWIAEKNFDE